MKYLFLSILMFVPQLVFAETGSVVRDTGSDGSVVREPGSGSVSINNPLKAGTVEELFLGILDILLIFAVPIVVFFIIYAGFLYVTARGNENTISQAHRALLYAVIGGVLILGANVLIDVLQGTVDSISN